MRLFIAIELSPPLRRAAYQLAAELKSELGGSCTREENLHLTLAFLGEQPRERLFAVRKCMERAAAQPLTLAIGGVGCFKRRDGDIWWLGVRRSEELIELQSRLAHELTAAGFELEEREFKPHMTLLRRASRREDFIKPDFPALEQRVERITLFESLRERGALVYRPLAKAELNR